LTAAAFASAAALGSIMALAWLIQHKSGNSGWVDVSWSLGVGLVAFLVALYPMHANWPHWRQLAVAFLALCWCLRLGWHIAQRTIANGDDPRYRNLAGTWGSDAPRRMFCFLQSQSAVGVVLVVAIALAAHNDNLALRTQDLLGFALLAGAIAGEAIADRQLKRFKANAINRGGICEVGLWRLSRHPNYFFEWLGWLAYPVVAIDLAGHNPLGPLALAAPVCMYWVLVHVSGVPPLEQHLLSTRGVAFRGYQRRTRIFFPLPKW
jgi:steroid 5-alpha reductase family enzyme